LWRNNLKNWRGSTQTEMYFQINLELTSTFLLCRGLVHHHHRILKLQDIMNLNFLTPMFGIWSCKPLIFQTQFIWSYRIDNLKGIRKSVFFYKKNSFVFLPPPPPPPKNLFFFTKKIFFFFFPPPPPPIVKPNKVLHYQSVLSLWKLVMHKFAIFAILRLS